jgi:hypothetical protein
MALEQDHPHRRRAVGRRRGERHGVGVVGLGERGLAEPGVEQRQRIVVRNRVVFGLHALRPIGSPVDWKASLARRHCSA